MAKLIFRENNLPAVITKAYMMNYFRSKFFSLYMNKFEIEGLSYDQQRFFLTQLWEKGTIAGFILKGSKPSSLVLKETVENPDGILVLCPYAPYEYNIYNYPTKVTLVKLRGVDFIPSEPQRVGKDVVIGFAHTSHMPIRSIVEYYVERIANVEKTIDVQLFTNKLPRLVVVSPEDKERVANIVKKVEEGENVVFVDALDYQALNNILDNPVYIIDKLRAYQVDLMNECLTTLGLDNSGMQKREREIVDEINANNQVINSSNDTFTFEMEQFVKQVNEILGYKSFKITSKELPVVSVYEENEQIENEGGDEE